jgi:hypothetical protein
MEWQLVARKGNGPFAMFDVREAFFFRRRQDLAVFHEARGRIMIGGIDSQGVHVRLPELACRCLIRRAVNRDGSAAVTVASNGAARGKDSLFQPMALFVMHRRCGFVTTTDRNCRLFLAHPCYP